MSIDKHISSVIKTCFLQLREFRHYQSFIPKSAITFANVFLNTRIDNCNCLLYCLQKYYFHCLQKFKTVACIVTCTSRSSHITPIFKSLHWLSIKYRVNFKLCCITNHALSLG